MEWDEQYLRTMEVVQDLSDIEKLAGEMHIHDFGLIFSATHFSQLVYLLR